MTTDVRFLLVYETENLNTLNMDGLLGLAPGMAPGRTAEKKTILQQMQDQGQLKEKIFSIYLGLTDD